MITIYDFPHGARGLRAAWLCEEMALEHEFRAVSFPPQDDYRRLNPLGTVPLLQDGSTEVSESVAMLLYIAMTYGPTPLLPASNDPLLGPVLQYAVFGEATLASPMNMLLAARFGAPPDQKRNWSVGGVEGRVTASVNHLAKIMRGRDYVVGSQFTIADISVSTALKIWTRALQQALPSELQVYCDRLDQRPARMRALAAHQ